MLVSARSYDDFEVVSDFLSNPQPDNQARIRRRGQRFPNGSILWTYQHTVRTVKNEQMLELRTSLNQRDYWVWLQLLFSLFYSHLAPCSQQLYVIVNKHYSVVVYSASKQ